MTLLGLNPRGRLLWLALASPLVLAPLLALLPSAAWSGETKVLRHIGVPYANFVTGLGDGFSVDLIKGFAASMGWRYTFVESSWPNVIGDLIGKRLEIKGAQVKVLGDAPVRGDLIATGLTRLPWRERLVAFSTPTFPTQVWLVTRSSSPLRPASTDGTLQERMERVLRQVKGLHVMGKRGTCLDCRLYGIQEHGGLVVDFQGSVNELVPALLAGEADATLLDVPDTLVALQKWPGRIKVIGPVSPPQVMGVAFPKEAKELRERFNAYLARIKADGTYYRLVKRYYPVVFQFFPEFFKDVHK